ncbi:MAG: methyltransferase domain-containing protein [Kiritimatiellia bacterium]|nr:methyltransferase domain-containing protein [Kiritimatiellia bacterium]
MNSSPIEYLRCPVCGGKLATKPNALQCAPCQRSYPVADEIPALLAQPNENDAALDAETGRYPMLMLAFAVLAHVWLPTERKRLIGQLGIRPGDMVLDHCTGPGENFQAIASLVGPSGKLVAMDLSRAMVKEAQRFARAKHIAADIQQADALKLPYADNCFNAVVHYGAINQFDDKRKAIDEMLRVTKPGGVITILDEGLKPGNENTWLSRLLIWKNKLFASQPPLDLIPPATNPRIEWVLNGICYQIIFRKPSV